MASQRSLLLNPLNPWMFSITLQKEIKVADGMATLAVNGS